MTFSREAVGAAPGKAILIGEHFVVYGAPALALPLSLVSVTVRLEVQEGAPAAPGDGHFRACLEECQRRFGGPDPATLRVRADGLFPVRAGLGSSAALAVAAARAWNAGLGREVGDAELLALADACESRIHGAASGIDARTVLASGLVRFLPGAELAHLEVRPGIGLLVLDTGLPRKTVEMVQRVAAWRESRPALFAGLFERAERLAEQAAGALARGDADRLGATFDANQELLGALGVSAPEVDSLIALARLSGATGAKLTGGGGGGCVIAVCPGGRLSSVRAALEGAGATVVVAQALEDES